MSSLSPITNEIEKYEAESSVLETSQWDRNNLMRTILQYSNTFLENLPDAKAYEHSGYQSTKLDKEALAIGRPAPMEDLLTFIRQRTDKPGLNAASGGHLGYIPGGGIFESAVADYIAAITNNYAGVFYAAPGAVRMENALIRWAGNLIGYKGRFGGNITSGGSIANLIAVTTARNTHRITAGNINSSVIYTTRQMHHSLLKVLKITGLHECPLRIVHLDNEFRMDTTHLLALIQEDEAAGLSPFLVIANAGSTDVGAVDPLLAIATVARQHRLWYHIDAAYGGFFMLTKYGQNVMTGIEQADSVILDPHKGLFLPYGTGMVLIRSLAHLKAAFKQDANYMQDTHAYDEEYSPADVSPELSKHFRGLRMWFPLKLHGLEPFRAALNEKLLLAHYFYFKVKKLGFEAPPFPDLSVVLFRYVPANGNPDTFNQKILFHIQQDGHIFISSTTIEGIFYLRAAILSFRTHRYHIDQLLKLLQTQLRHLSNEETLKN